MENSSSRSTMSNSQNGPIFHPYDLARMRHAYDKACHEGMMADSTEAQRTGLAKAIVFSYKSGLTEAELVAAALILTV